MGRMTHSRRCRCEEKPVVVVVEMEEHFSLGMKHIGNPRLLHAAVSSLPFADVGEQRVAFLAAVGVLEVVAKFEGVVEVEAVGLNDEVRQFVERPIAPEDDLGGKAVVLDFEVVLLHGREIAP